MAEKYARERKALRKEIDTILTKRVLYIDPASKSAGFAISEGGTIVKSGTIEAKGHIAVRLATIYKAISYLGKFDLMVVEKVRQPRGHFMLIWSVGVAVAAANVPVSCEVTTNMWSEAKDEAYFKNDENDALYLGYWTLGFAKGDYI